MMPAISDDHVEHALKILQSQDGSKARAAHDYLSEMRKVVLARLRGDCNEKTAAAKDDFAHAHPDYAEHLEQLRHAAEEDYKHRDRRAAAQAVIDAWRTEQSNARTAGRIG